MPELLKNKKSPLLELLNSTYPDKEKRELIMFRTILSVATLLNSLKPEQKKYLFDCGFVDRVVYLYEDGENKIRECSAILLGTLAKDNDMIKLLIDKNVIPSILSALKSGKSQLSQSSLLLLYNLCQDLDSVLSIGQQGTILPVIDLLKGSSPGLAMKTLIALSFAHPNAEIISDTNALQQIVDYMSHEEEELSKMAISTAFLFSNHSIFLKFTF